jgi:predicted AlkP superfamily phosphohydrolase/phosphomutase
MAGYAEPHWAGHYFFHLLDPSHPRYDADVARACGGAILDVYREIDRGIDELAQAAPESTVIVYSNTGMGINYSGQHLVPEVLERLGMSGDRGKRAKAAGDKSRNRWGAYAIKTVETAVSAKNIQRVRNLVPEKFWDKYTRIFLNLGNDWRNSKAFAVPSDYTGAIRINLKGREPHGTVAPGEEYDRICAELAREFLALVNPATGRPAVTEVVRLRDRYRGAWIDELPDLIVQWEGAHPIDALQSPRIGTVSGVIPDKRSGAHTTHGFMVACGEGIRKTRDLAPADIVDIAPTVLLLQGMAAPAYMDGRALIDMIEESPAAVAS